MEVFKATNNHLESLVEIRLTFLKELHSFSPEEEEELRTKLTVFFNASLNKTLFCYVIEQNDKIISSVFLLVSEKIPVAAKETGRFGTILNVYTCPSYRKQGLSRKNLKVAIKESRNHELDKLILAATESGYPLYKQFGFKETQAKYASMELRLN